MNRSGIGMTLLSIALVVVAVLSAVLLSAATPEDSYIDGNNNQQTGENPGSSSAADPSRLPNPEPLKGGLSGGNTSAICEGRLPGFEDQAPNDDPDVFCYLLNSEVVLETPDGVANILAENDPGNLSLMQLCYYLDTTGELVYVSPMLEPGQHINGDELTVKLEKGSYKINAVITVYDEQTLEPKTTFHQQVQLTVSDKFLGIF